MTKEISPTPEFEIGQSVYVLGRNNSMSVQEATIDSQSDEAFWVRGPGALHRVDKSEVFTTVEIADRALDLMAIPDPGEEVYIGAALRAVIDHPLAGQELYIRMVAEATSRYLTEPRTERELGLKDPDQQNNTNRKIIDELQRGIDSGQYQQGADNSLHLSHVAPEVKLLPEAEATAFREEVYTSNRQHLGTLYNDFGVDYSQAEIVERSGPDNMLERTTLYPTNNGFTFVERAIFYKNEDGEAGDMFPFKMQATIVVGRPQEYTIENGYYPA